MTDVDVKLWSVKRSALYGVGAGIIWYLFSTSSEPNYATNPTRTFILFALNGCLLFAVVAWVRNLAELAAAASLERKRRILDPVWAAEEHDNEEETCESPLALMTPEEQEIRKAAQAFKRGQDERSAAYKAQQDGLREAKELAERADEFASNSHLDIAVPYLFDEMRHWPSWSERDDADEWIPSLGQTVTGGEGDSYSHQTITWRWSECEFSIAFKRHATYFHDDLCDDEYSDMSVSVDGQQVFKFTAKRNALSEFDRWAYCQVEAIIVGPWVSELVEFYSALRTHNERTSSEIDAAYHIERAANIDLSNAEPDT